MDRDRLVRLLAEVVSGLQVPASIGGGGVLGAALQPWQRVYDELHPGIGWSDADELETALRERLVGDVRT